MESRVNTILHKQITIELDRVSEDHLGKYVVLKVTGCGRQYPDHVHMYMGNTLTFDIPLKVDIGW